ncbi:MAG TPA: glycoside hydrolase domain-containing protein [Acidobacteriaceae bacterium]|nr:glycoside hydrolase domain-containing protein [Acidobacteriaceae bacterium]
MKRSGRWLVVSLLCAGSIAGAQTFGAWSYFGFDKNGYPGDALLAPLHRTFAYTGYWLNDPPGMTANPWAGKRGVVRAAGFGFLLLFNGRLEAQLKGQNAASLGELDGRDAVLAAEREGFPAGAIIFLDQEEGGALTKEQAVYMEVWIHAVQRSSEQRSGYRAGVYASGIAVPAGAVRMSTAQDVRTRFPEAALWVWNDACPPAPGCVVPRGNLKIAQSGFPGALVWQYAQAPRRPEDTEACAKTYAADNQCYAPGLPQSPATRVDLDVSWMADPSQGR